MSKFGHLRPNTYEISNSNYKENFNLYFNDINIQISKNKKFKFSKNQIDKINQYLINQKFKKFRCKSSYILY